MTKKRIVKVYAELDREATFTGVNSGEVYKGNFYRTDENGKRTHIFFKDYCGESGWCFHEQINLETLRLEEVYSDGYYIEVWEDD